MFGISLCMFISLRIPILLSSIPKQRKKITLHAWHCLEGHPAKLSLLREYQFPRPSRQCIPRSWSAACGTPWIFYWASSYPECTGSSHSSLEPLSVVCPEYAAARRSRVSPASDSKGNGAAAGVPGLPFTPPHSNPGPVQKLCSKASSAPQEQGFPMSHGGPSSQPVKCSIQTQRGYTQPPRMCFPSF